MTPGVDVFGLSDVGKKRTQNDDHFLVASLRKAMEVRHTNLAEPRVFDRFKGSEAFLFVIADGVGGVGGGNLASSTAVEALVGQIGHTMDSCYNYNVDLEHEFIERLQRAVERTDETVRTSLSGGGRRGPATTLTLLVLIWPRGYVIHIGDSRAYYLRRGKLWQLTRDQTMGDLLVDEGVMSESEVETAGLRNVLSSAIGADMTPAVQLIDFEPGDVLLLCTDGLTKHVSDDEIVAMLNRGDSAEVSCRGLVQAALDGGGSDNVSVIVARMPQT